MIDFQKRRIKYLRTKGKSYAVIAKDLGISENTIKSYCRRNNLGYGDIAEFSVQVKDTCENCDKSLDHKPQAKHKRFCSDKCRLLWWKTHPENLNRRAIYSFTCAHCGIVFNAYGNKKRKYCSHDCYVAGRFGKETVL